MPKAKSRKAANSSELADVMRKQRWREEDGRLVVEAWRKSGLSRLAFAQQFGVKPYRLEHWTSKVRRLELQRSRSRMPAPLEVYPVEVTDSERRATGGDAGRLGDNVEVIVPAGVRIRVGPDVRAETLRRVLEAVGC